jgi:diadenosine tetraphosphate (Ap4A) HIT family hydrolase
MDEAKQVHWHLVPRYDEKGFNLLIHNPKEVKDFPLAPLLREGMKNFSSNVVPVTESAGRHSLLHR